MSNDPLNPAPNRTGQLTAANSETNARLAPVSPAAGAVLPQWAVVALTIAVAVAGTLPLIPGLPPVVTGIAGVVTAVGVAFGIASPGIRRKVE